MAIHEPQSSLPLPRFESPVRVLIVVAPYYRAIADMLIEGATTTLAAAGAVHEIVDVPGALELPPAIALAGRLADFDGFVALGCVIRGETTHYETVCNESARGLMDLGLGGAAIGNGILTVETHEQALVRADPSGEDKGGGAAAAALHLVALRRRWAANRRPVGFGGDTPLAKGGDTV